MGTPAPKTQPANLGAQKAAAPRDVYFSADVETDGPIPGPYSMLSFALVYAGTFDGEEFQAPAEYRETFYRELRPISENFQSEALRVNGLDRRKLLDHGADPATAMDEAASWIARIADGGRPVLVAYPLSFDWAWLYWYFVNFAAAGSPFQHSQCFDLKTAFAVKAQIPISAAGRSQIPPALAPAAAHTHNAKERLGRIGDLLPGKKEECDAVLAAYEEFLEATTRPEAELLAAFRGAAAPALLGGPDGAEKLGRAVFQAIQAIGDGSRFHRLLLV